jgi:hypothetical protein
MGSLEVPTEASNTAQAYYSLQATATTMSIYAVVNLPTTESDSFFFQVAGLSDWKTQNNYLTRGFESILLMTVDNAVVGQTYIFKIQRREAGAQLYYFRLLGGEFTKGYPDIPVPTAG